MPRCTALELEVQQLRADQAVFDGIKASVREHGLSSVAELSSIAAQLQQQNLVCLEQNGELFTRSRLAEAHLAAAQKVWCDVVGVVWCGLWNSVI